jgi:hypothetical protein
MMNETDDDATGSTDGKIICALFVAAIVACYCLVRSPILNLNENENEIVTPDPTMHITVY